MILPLRYYGDAILRKKSASIPEVNDEIRQLAADMIETIHYLKNAVGLAAPQVGHSVALFVVQFPSHEVTDHYEPGRIEVFINPKILGVSDETWFYSEGCLSIPNLYEDISRPFKVKMQAQNLNGKTFVGDYEGYEARMLLHENDHLNGVLFIDRISGKQRKEIEPQLRKIKNKYFLKK